MYLLEKEENYSLEVNMAPNGTSIIVELREDLLKVLKDNKDLKVLDDDLKVFI